MIYEEVDMKYSQVRAGMERFISARLGAALREYHRCTQPIL